MKFTVKTYIFIGALFYMCFLGWYFQKGQDSSGMHWHPSDAYTHVATVQETASSATAADQVFEAKTSVPMKTARSLRRRKPSRRAKSATVRMAMAAPARSYAITPVGEGIHTVSSAKFRSFGAWGLMSPSQQQSGRKRHTNKQENTAEMPVLYMLPYQFGAPEQNATEAQQQTQHNTIISVSVHTIPPR